MKIVIREDLVATFAACFDRDAEISHNIYCILGNKVLQVNRTECQLLDSRLEDTRTAVCQHVKKYSRFFIL
jgi:hypothetical protein